MKRAYLLIYSDATGTREEIKNWADSESQIETWRYDLPHCFYLISEASAKDLAKSLRAFTGEKGRFLISEAGDNRNGWLPQETWHLLRTKSHKPKGK